MGPFSTERGARRKRSILGRAVIALIALALIAAACGDDDSSPSDSDPPSQVGS